MRSKLSQTAISLSGGVQSSAITLPPGGGPFHVGKEPRCVS